MTKYFGATLGNGAVSGLKDNLADVESWAESQLQTTKATRVFIFEAVSEFTVAPRTIVKMDLRPTEENTRPDMKCETCDPLPVPILPVGSTVKEIRERILARSQGNGSVHDHGPDNNHIDY